MNTTSRFELDALKRDWIEGISGDVFWQCVQKYIRTIAARIDSATERGVLIAESDPIEFAAAFFASADAGVPVILANPNWQRSEWEQLSQQVNPAVVFGELGIAKKKPAGTNHPQPGTILIPTGGSSGRLKLAVHNWDTLTSACEGFQAFVGPGPIHSCCVLPLYHVSGLMQLMRSFVSGGQIVFTDYKLLRDGQFSSIKTNELCLSLVPTQLQRLLKQEVAVSWLRDLKMIFLGGASFTVNLQSVARKLQLPIVPTYGMTETAAMITALRVEEFLSGSVGVGHSLQHAEVQVIREDGSHCLADEHGQIKIKANSLCLGYHGVSETVAKDGYLSADDGYLDRNGYLYIVGRSDRVIISGGEKIDPLEIESAFLSTGAVGEVLAAGWADAEWGERLIVFYVPAGRADSVEQLRECLKTMLVNFKIPREIIQVSQLPLTAQGKPDRGLIKELMEKM